MDTLLWILGALAAAVLLWVVVSFVLAAVMLIMVARGYFGDMTDLTEEAP